MAWIKDGGVYTVTVNEVSNSSSIPGYSKAPFVKFVVTTDKNDKFDFVIFLGRDAVERERAGKKITALGANAGLSSSLKGDALLNAMVGQQVKVVMKERDDYYVKRDTQEPILTKRLYFSFSKKASDMVTGLTEKDLVIPPKQGMEEEFATLKQEWDAKQGTPPVPAMSPNQDFMEMDDSDLPF